MTRPPDWSRSDRIDQAHAVHETTIGDRRPSEVVVDACAALRDVEPAALSPLYDTLDPDALDTLWTNSAEKACLSVRFDYAGLLVTISPPDTVTIVEP